MKSSIQISIPKPCHEQWDNFIPSSSGRVCQTCNKAVVDFTKMSDEEVLNYLKGASTQVCGRMHIGQLKMYKEYEVFKFYPSLTFLRAGMVSILFALISKPISAQYVSTKSQIETVQTPSITIVNPALSIMGQWVRGTVKDEGGDPLPGVNVILKGSMTGTVTDAKGEFEFPIRLEESDVLIFALIGFESKEYKIPKIGKEIILVEMKMDDMVLMGELSVDNMYSSKKGISRWWMNVKKLF